MPDRQLLQGKEGSFMQITKETIIGDILDADFNVAPYFLEIGMHCLGCPASRGESIEDACAVHGTDPDALVQKLNAHFAEKA
jgi:hybrid cluster-associated redox disulfide protein